jgi:carboxyl-terminal processing protease
MKSLPVSKFRYLLVSASLLLISGGIGYRLGEQKVSFGISPQHAVVVHTKPEGANTVDFSLFWDVWQKVNQYYIEPKTIDTQKLVYGAISGMVAAVGDPYTSFFPPKDNKDFKDELGGAFEGIGAELGLKDGRVIIVTPLRQSPAEKAGLKSNDIIVQVDGQDTYGWTVEQAVSKIRGPKHTNVKLTILHETAQKTTEITIERDTITIPSVVWWIKVPKQISEISVASESASFINSPKKIAYLSLFRFGDNTNDFWTKAVTDIAKAQKEKDFAGLVLDLRNNPGGYLDGAVYIGSEFVKSGVIVSQINSDGTKENYNVNRPGQLLDIPIVILINKGSASAAEILAGALRDHNRATIVGVTSFGKGSVQTPFDLAQGTSVHITTGKWYLPKGDSISKKGITPDFIVEQPDALTASNDAQLAKAIDILLQ